MASSSASASPSPKSPEISEKSKKYDRQLRLWGDHGQSKLESSRICVINANATGTEILKSLILPGCGTFTIIDNRVVAPEDIGNNFFLETESLNKNRGMCAGSLLRDLNPDVNGEAIDDSTEHILSQDANYFTRFSVVIASELTEKDLIILSKNLWERKIPFIYCQCIGLVGWIRVQLNEHTIVESHPGSSTHDLRLDLPFSELTTYIDNISVAHNQRGAVLKMPWLVLLFKAIQHYLAYGPPPPTNNGVQVVEGQDGNNDRMEVDVELAERIHPCHMSSTEKKVFRAKSLSTYLKGLGLNETDEVVGETDEAANVALSLTEIPPSVMEIINDPIAQRQIPQGSLFWVMCSALAQFVNTNGVLPVSGTLPDMRAESQKYISLQTIYRDRAAKDADDILQKCQVLIREQQIQGVKLRPDEIRLFCKESHNLKLIRGTPLFQELETGPTNVLEELAKNMEDFDEDKMFYIMLRGVLRFQTRFNTYPGALKDYEPDITRLKSIMNSLMNDWNSNLAIKDDYIHEICRYGAAEIPSVAGFIGGCVAQEAIKIITSQYVPLDNTLIYTAINSTTSSFAM